MKFEFPKGSTPLDPDEINGLIPNYITKQSELNMLEQQNILEAEIWLLKYKNKNALDVNFAIKLHRKMFEDIWKWAGVIRSSGKNIGVLPNQIMQKLPQLFENIKFRLE